MTLLARDTAVTIVKSEIMLSTTISILARRVSGGPAHPGVVGAQPQAPVSVHVTEFAASAISRRRDRLDRARASAP
jgi:hypothetical protein